MSNKVELLDYMGDDLSVTNTARVSYGKNKEKFDEKDIKLIKYLKEHGHTSPFRHPQLRFRVECSIYVERQIFKHQVGISINTISGRYVDFSDSYTKIDKWRQQSESSKQGSGDISPNHVQLIGNGIQDKIIEACSKAYADLIECGISKEQARTILPLCLNTNFIWTGSLLAFIHMCKLRLKEDAQLEDRKSVV